MNGILTFGVLLAAMAAVVIFAEFLIDVYYSWTDRRDYRRRTHPRNIEKNSQDLLEQELQQFLLEEEIKERARNRMEHPSNYSKKVGGGLDGSTKEILANLTNPRERQSRMFEKPSRHDRNNQYWWGE